MGTFQPQGTPTAPEMKYCADCGKQIFRKAEVCPHCGCRQLPLIRKDSSDIFGLGGITLEKVWGAVCRKTGEKRDSRTEEPSANELKGIGGWLLVFWVIVAIVSPIANLHELAENGYNWYPIPIWMSPNVCWVSIIFHIAVGMIMLRKKRTSLYWVNALLIAHIAYPLFIYFGVGYTGDLARDLPSMLTAGVWLVYFMRSVRVKNTYGRNLLAH